MENEVIAGWQLGTASIIAGVWVILWFVGRPLLHLIRAIGGFFKRLGGMIQRLIQPIFEFLYRSIYTLLQAATAVFLGFVVYLGFTGEASLSPGELTETALATLVMIGMTNSVFRHFASYPLRQGHAQQSLQRAQDFDPEDVEADFDLDL